jgi:4-methyl-5(b-hydroxyethyl)-thiazole monophosphate biosynthesis
MVAILLADGFEEVEAVTPADFLRRAGLDVRLVGVTGRTVTGGHGITITADTTIEEMEGEPEALVVPGGGVGAENLAASEPTLELIRKTHGAGKLVAAICAAPAIVLHKAGILTGRRVTCYPGFENMLTGCTFCEERVVLDGNVLTSRSPGTAAEFSLQIVEILAGKDAAGSIHTATLQR